MPKVLKLLNPIKVQTHLGIKYITATDRSDLIRQLQEYEYNGWYAYTNDTNGYYCAPGSDTVKVIQPQYVKVWTLTSTKYDKEYKRIVATVTDAKRFCLDFTKWHPITARAEHTRTMTVQGTKVITSPQYKAAYLSGEMCNMIDRYWERCGLNKSNYTTAVNAFASMPFKATITYWTHKAHEVTNTHKILATNDANPVTYLIYIWLVDLCNSVIASEDNKFTDAQKNNCVILRETLTDIKQKSPDPHTLRTGLDYDFSE